MDSIQPDTRAPLSSGTGAASAATAVAPDPAMMTAAPGASASATKTSTMLPLSWLAVLLAAAEFILRALRRTDGSWLSDLAAPYISTRLWMSGANPYDSHHFLGSWYAAGATSLGFSSAVTNIPSVYPPPTLPFMVPFAVLRWPDAVHAFVVCGVLLYGLVLYKLLRLGWSGHRSWRNYAHDPLAVFFLAFALGFAPAHTAINSENIVLFSACAALLAVLTLLQADAGAEHGMASWIAGALVVASICIKPTTGLFLLVWLGWERRWRLIAGVCAACALIAALSLWPLLARHTLDWIASYRANVATLFTHGGNADVSLENSERTDHIDLQLVLFAIFGDRGLSSAIAAGIYALVLAAFLRGSGWFRSPALRRTTEMPLLAAGGIMALGLLPVYSRIYSAIVLLPLVLWCFRHLRFESARWLLFLLCGFLANTSALLRRPAFVQAIAARAPRLWDATVGGHTCWLLLAIGILLIRAAAEQTTSQDQAANENQATMHSRDQIVSIQSPSAPSIRRSDPLLQS